MKASLLFSLSILLVGNLPAADPVWIFNNGPDAKRISMDQGQLYSEVGLTKLIPTGTDLTMTVPMKADEAFSADARPFFAFRYKYKTTIGQAGLFFTTDTLTTLSDVHIQCTFGKHVVSLLPDPPVFTDFCPKVTLL